MDQIKQIWIDDTGEEERIDDLWPYIEELAGDDPVALVDRVMEAGMMDEALELSPEALDEITALAAPSDEPEDSPESHDDEAQQFAANDREDPGDMGGEIGKSIGNVVKSRLNKLLKKN